MAREYGLSVLLLHPLAQLVARVDPSATTFLADLGVDRTTSVDAYVAAGVVDEALSLIARRRGDASFGLSLARSAVRNQFGFFGHLVWLAPTLGDAIERAARFYCLVTERSTVELTTDGQLAKITQHVRPGAPRGAILTEYLFASFVLRGALAAGRPLRVRHVSLAHESPDRAAYEELFGAPVSYGAPKDTIGLDHADLALPLATADATTAALLEERALAMSRALLPTDPFLDQVRLEMLTRLRESRDLTIDGLARALASSSRTLQRRLEERGTSHRQLLDEVRCTIAKHLLREGRSAAEVAYEVCFATPQAFHKAFLRWTGRTPGEARRLR